MKLYIASFFGLLMAAASSFGQITLLDMNNGTIIDFSDYAGSGFSSTGATGYLDSRNWRVDGLVREGTSVTSSSFGDDRDSAATGGNRFGQGESEGGTGSSGLISFDVSNGGTVNRALGLVPNRNDKSPDPDAFVLNSGGMELQIENNTGSTVTGINFIYDIYEFNDRNSEYKLDFSVDGTDVGSASYTTTDARQGTTANTDWNTTPITRSGSVIGLNWTTSSFLIFRWEGVSVDINDLQLDEIALDNISITAIPEPSTYVLWFGGLALGVVFWKRKKSRSNPL